MSENWYEFILDQIKKEWIIKLVVWGSINNQIVGVLWQKLVYNSLNSKNQYFFYSSVKFTWNI